MISTKLGFSWTHKTPFEGPRRHPSKLRYLGRRFVSTSTDSDGRETSVSLTETEAHNSWNELIKWSQEKRKQNGVSELENVSKIAVFGGGCFGTAMGVALARKKSSLKVQLLIRDSNLVQDINVKHVNTKYLQAFLWTKSPFECSFSGICPSRECGSDYR